MKRRRAHDYELSPDEIFLDSSNLPEFDRSRLEGRLEFPISDTTYVGIVLAFALLLVVLLGQAWNLEVRQGTMFAAQSARNSLRQTVLFPNRGAITDRNGVVLAENVTSASSTTHRVYKTPGFANVVGYVSYPKKDSNGNYYETDTTGLAGVEASFNTELAGENGSHLVEEDALGKQLSEGSIIAPKNGQNLTLSIDSRVQTALYDAIGQLADRIPFDGGSGILMDVNTGELLALVSYPQYDPNVLSEGGPSSVINGYLHDSRQVYLNRPVQGLYTPGSVVKPLEASGALTDHIITPSYTINDTGSISVPNPYDPAHPSIFKDWKAIGVEDLRTAIAWSSDVYFYTVGGGFGGLKGLGIDRLNFWYSAFGLTTPTGVELPGEKSGFVPTPAWKEATLGEPWRIGDTYHTAIGQYAMQVTPIEMARAIAAVANGGKLLKPTLIKGAPMSGESLAVNPSDLQVVREGMRKGVTEGTSVGLNDLSFVTPAGKTGTAQLGYHNEFYNSWAVGFFPYDKPTYVYVVVMEHGPSGNSLGGIYAVHQFLTNLHAVAPEYFE